MSIRTEAYPSRLLGVISNGISGNLRRDLICSYGDEIVRDLHPFPYYVTRYVTTLNTIFIIASQRLFVNK